MVRPGDDAVFQQFQHRMPQRDVAFLDPRRFLIGHQQCQIAFVQRRLPRPAEQGRR